MAKGEIKMPEDFLLKLSRLGDKSDEIISRVLGAGGEVALEKVRGNLEAVIGRDTKHKSRSTGELADALGLSPVKLSRDGTLNIKLGFAEPRSGGGVNALVAATLEYGKQGQPAKPFLRPARTASRKLVIAEMVKVYEEEVERL
jgi:HK97 gp10 family phage protein